MATAHDRCGCPNAKSLPLNSLWYHRNVAFDDNEPNSQNRNSTKINPEKAACFSSPNPDRQLPSFHQQSTTTSPPKNHVQPPVFRQNPRQKQGPTTHKKITAEAPLFEQGLASSGGLRRQPICPGLQGRGPWHPQPAQTLRLRRMVQGCPKNPRPRVPPENATSPNSPILWGFSRF